MPNTFTVLQEKQKTLEHTAIGNNIWNRTPIAGKNEPSYTGFWE
jgi:hypothetical protein